jgi:signal transduction histidine kinase
MSVLRTGQSQRVPELTREMLARGAQDAEHLRMMEALEFHAYLAVALRVGESSRGVLALFSSQPERRYTAADQVMVEELLGRAALALDNARLLREAQQALELIGVASHDLGNPLQTLQLHLQRLKRHEPAAEPDKVRDGLEAALRQAQKLGQMLHNLLDFSRLSSGQMALDLAGVDLGELVQEVAGRHAEQAAETGCGLEVDAQLGLLGRWDRLRLERVVTNLLSNALKFGKGRPVELRVRREEGRARLVVRDHGDGIPLEAQQKIFDRFERQPSGGKHAGFGLGLYIVRQLVEAHGGTIRVESQPGEGAAFIVELPLTAGAEAGAEQPPAAPH